VTNHSSQLILSFPRTSGFGVADLLPNGAQDEARAWLDSGVAWPLGRLALWGKPGSGKSHLAHVWADRVGGIVLPAAPTEGWPRRPVALDAIDTVPDEPALLFLLNACAEANQPVLLISRTAPGRLPVRLPDLASRLRATTAVQIGPADDAFLAILLTRLLADRQLRLPPALQSWLLTRLTRTPAAVRDAVTRLDAAAFTMQRPITRQMAAEVLGFCDNSADVASGTSPLTQDVS
jgi:chromosomal replication initiation ATPase DnaA